MIQAEQTTTKSIPGPRRAVKLNAETLRALEAQPIVPMQFSIATTACSAAGTCFTCHCGTPACPQ
jgi:hypothetical protein